MATVDSLDIQIIASAKSANDSVDKLIGKINSLSSTLNKINVSHISSEFAKLSKSMSGIKINAFSDFTKSAKNAENSMNRLAKETNKGIKTKATFDASDFEKTIAELSKKFSGAGKDIKFSGTLSQLEKQYEKLDAKLDKLVEKEKKIISVGTTSPESTLFKNLQYDISSTLNQMDTLSDKIEKLQSAQKEITITGLNETVQAEPYAKPKVVKIPVESMNFNADAMRAVFGEGTESIRNWGEAVEKFGQNAGSVLNSFSVNTDSTKNKMSDFQSALSQLQIPPVNETNLEKLQSSLSKTENKLEELQIKLANGLMLGNINESIDDKAFVRLKEQIVLTEKQAEALKQKIEEVERAAGNTGGIQKFGNAIKNAAGSILHMSSQSAKAVKPINSLGNSFKGLIRTILPILGIRQLFNWGKQATEAASDLIEVQNVVDTTFGNMSAKVDELAKHSIQDFGMSELTAKQISGRFQAMGVAMGFSQGKMSDMSIELTKLAADMASFYNVAQEDVAKSLESVFTGTTMPLRKYGLDLTQATLQEWLHKQGIDAKISSMNQMEKTMLRYQYVLANTGAAQGDFARTADTWANQIRILKQNFQQLAGILGGAFVNALKPLVKALNAVMGYINSFARTVSNALGKIFGWTYEESGGGIAEDYEAAEDAAGGLADNTGKAAKNIKKMQAGLRAFDELKVINLPEKDKDFGKGNGAGAGAGIGAGAGGEWKQTDDKLEKYKSSLDNLYKLGEYIGNAMKKAMDNIPWDSIYEKAKGFGKGLADFLNGLFAGQKGETLFGKVGKTIAGALNTVIYAALSFAEIFDWRQFGQNLADGINNFFSTFDFVAAAETINTWLKGVLKTVITLLKETDFVAIGEKIGKFLKELDFIGIAGDVAQTLWDGLKAAFDLLTGLIKEAPLESAIIAAVGVMKFTSLGSTIATKFGRAIALAIPAAIAGFNIGQMIYEQISGEEIDMTFSEQMDTIAESISDGSWKDALSLMGDDVWNFFVELGDAIKDWADGVNEKISNFFAGAWEFISSPFIKGYKAIKDAWNKAVDWFKKLIENIKKVFEAIKEHISAPFKNAWNLAKDVWGKVSGWFNDKIKTPVTNTFNTLKTNVSNAFSKAWNLVKDAWSTVSGWFTEKIKTPVTNTFNSLKTSIHNAFKNAWSLVKDVWNKASGWFTDNIKTPVTNTFSSLKTNIKNAFKNAYDGIKSTFGKIGDFFVGIANKIITPIGKAVNGIIKGINWVLGKVGSKTTIKLWDVPKFANGAEGLPQNTLGIVNDQKGNTYKELIVPPHGKPFIPEGRNVMLPMEKGTKIMPADQTKEFMQKINGMPHFAGGIGDFFGGAWEKLKDFTGNIMDYISNPKKILQIAIDKFTEVSNLFGPLLSIAKGAAGKIADSAVGFIKNIFDKELTVTYDASKGVGQWKGLAEKALQITHQFSDNNLTYLLNQMYHESGGNPKAINLWDINAKNGTPSKGLMQLIDATFKTYSLSPYNKDIYDPLSNIIASIRYTVSRYGSLYSGWAARGYKGYAGGGFPLPEDGWFRVSAGEIMGKFDNGQSVVANNYQITSGISDAVQKGNQENNMLMRQEISLLKRQNELLAGILQKEFGISKNDIGTAARDWAYEYNQRTGEEAFIF